MRSYLQHGRRHGTRGSDPIPPIGLPVASLFSNPTGVTVAGDGALHYISIQDGVSSAGFSTSHSSIFTNGSSTSFTGSAVYGIEIDDTGTYAVYTNSFTISGGTAGKKVTAYWAASNGSAPSHFQQGRSAAILSDVWDKGQVGIGPHLFTHEVFTVASGQTPAVLARTGQIEAGSDVVISFQMVVVQLSPTVLTSF